MIRYQW